MWTGQPGDDSVPHILFTCGREPQYTRNDVILRALRARYRLTEITDSRPGSLTRRLVCLTVPLVRALRQPHNLVVVGFYGYPLVWLVRRLTRQPILFDAFVSTYDTLVLDRGLFGPDSLLARLALSVDRLAGYAADLVLLDTEAQATFFHQITGVPRARVASVYVSCNESLFHPDVPPDRHSDSYFNVLYYGTYQPLHGMEVVVAAARALRHESSIRWRIIGRGQTYPRVRRLAHEWGLTNVAFDPPVPYADLPRAIASADLCLGGPFGSSDKAQRVITGKSFQFLSMRKPVIVGDTPANRELLIPGENVYAVPLEDPEALAAAVQALASDPGTRERLAASGHARYRLLASEAAVGTLLDTMIRGMLK